VRRIAELLGTAQDAVRLLSGGRLTDGQALGSLSAEVDAALQHAGSAFAVPPDWRPRERLTTVGDVAVIELRHGAELAAVLKLSRSPSGDTGLKLQQDILHTLAADPRLAGWHDLLPDVLAHGLVGQRRYVVESAVPGIIGTSLSKTVMTENGLRSAVMAISALHRATGGPVVATGSLLDSWLEPALSLIPDVPMLRSRRRRLALISAIRRRVWAGLEDRTIWVGRTHGDYTPGNIFYDPTSTEVRGIVDWAQSRHPDPVLIDPMTLLLVGRALTQRKPLGQVVRELCEGAPLSPHHMALVEAHRAACPADAVAVDVMALMAWLRHVETNLVKSPRYAAHPVWVHRNVEVALTTAGRGVSAPRGTARGREGVLP
jgi:Ser/Thr protein kinase RdoA (MazF antagonist)